MTATKPKLPRVKQGHLPLNPLPWAQFQLTGPQLFCNFQWCLHVKEPGNSVTLASSQAQETSSQLQLSCASDCTPLPLEWYPRASLQPNTHPVEMA